MTIGNKALATFSIFMLLTGVILYMLTLKLIESNVQKPELVTVKCVAIHHYGDTLAKGGRMHEVFTHMTVERIDTKERRNYYNQILGQTNEVFKILWYPDYQM